MNDNENNTLAPASMKKSVMPVMYGLLAIYTLVLMVLEYQTSQDYIRHYFADITGPVDLFAINTTLSVFLMWGTALLFLVSLVCVIDQTDSTRMQWFLLSQILVFAFLGFDHRFQFHEKVSWHLGFPDHFILIAVAILETGFLLFLGGREVINGRAAMYLGIAVVLFVIMLVIDALVPHELVLRLSAEDLAKLWGCLFFFLFAWEICMREIFRLKEASR